jgi:hypothetical protein
MIRSRPLYLTEAQIARALGANTREWPSIAAALELDGLPKVDPIFGGRYWPAVKAFLDRRHGIAAQIIPSMPDGAENWS